MGPVGRGAVTAKRCKDCPPGSKRPANYPGPRCATHHRAVRAARRERSRAQYVERTYNITDEQYWALYEAQGGACYICQRAKGTGRKRLSVDHDHSCCPGSTSCGKCVRGLLCKPCNRDVLGHLRDEIEAFERAAAYLRNPPAKAVFSLAS
ncbi:endonuclease VII domain-containing protein [Amycolatopsis anabasis]|uniref:endonuclease VII domain-containing protein n=1 Tax=Amycolatopsis anabasis TaxID=1840409 RepID=UPI003CCE3D1E